MTPKFKIGDIVKHTFPPYRSNAKITDIFHNIGDHPKYLLDDDLVTNEESIELIAGNKCQQNSTCKDCHGTGTITLFTSIVECNCIKDI